MSAQVDALGRRTEMVYDARGNHTATHYPDGTSEITVYDEENRVVAKIDRGERTTTFEYNGAGQLTAVVDALEQRTVYGYDSRGRKTSQTDALQRTTRWEYDDDGRVVARVLPLGQRETMEYDDVGQLSAKTDFNGARTTYRYDAADRVEEVRHADGTGVISTYTDNGQVETQTDAAGTTHYLYDARDRLLSVTHPDGVSIAYEYDAAGNRTRMTTSQQDIGYTYDALNRLETVTRNGQVTRYTYTAVGSRERITLPTGARTDYTYDARNRLRTLAHSTSNGNTLLHQTYTVDASGLRTQLVEYGQNIGATRTVAYTYDPLKRLRREEVTDSTRGNRVSAWTYDATGNRQSETRTKAGVSVTTTYAYDANDRLEGEAGSDGTTISYAYDDNGSLIGKQDAAGTSVYSYDGDRRLVDAITPNAGLSYRYDANGIRQSQTVNGVTTRFVVDPTAQYAQVLEERSSTGNVLYLLGDDRIARTQGGQTRYLHTDGLGSTRLLTDSTTVATDRWWYEAFGEVETSTGTSSNAFLFAGEQLDPNLGHYYLRARYMDPANGRFTQMDVWEGNGADPITLHKYVYSNASPASYVDPSGYASISEQIATMRIQATTALRSFAQSAGRIFQRSIASKEWIIFRVILGHQYMSHEFIWAKNRVNKRGIGYHVLAPPRRVVHSARTGEFVDGIFSIIPQPKPNEMFGRKVRIKSIEPVAYLGRIGFVLWSINNVGRMTEVQECPFPYQIPTSNCITWTNKAAKSAAVWQAFPM